MKRLFSVQSTCYSFRRSEFSTHTHLKDIRINLRVLLGCPFILVTIQRFSQSSIISGYIVYSPDSGHFAVLYFSLIIIALANNLVNICECSSGKILEMLSYAVLSAHFRFHYCYLLAPQISVPIQAYSTQEPIPSHPH